MDLAHAPSVALVTCAEYPGLTPDDVPLAAALARRGLRPLAALWDDPAVRWEEHAAVVLRSCWDYHVRAREFERWLDRLEQVGARVHNPLPTLRWNMRKTYLRDMAAAGVPVAPTVWAPQGSAGTLRAIAEATGWTAMVVKPTVSSTGWETWLAERVGDAEEERFARQLRERALMVQGFLPRIVTDGELSLVFLAGEYSHAVRKRARPGEFRVQEEHGGMVDREVAPPPIVAQAARALGAAPGTPLYARVDGVVADATLVVTELELLEPKLYFRWDDGAAETMAGEIEKKIGARG